MISHAIILYFIDMFSCFVKRMLANDPPVSKATGLQAAVSPAIQKMRHY